MTTVKCEPDCGERLEVYLNDLPTSKLWLVTNATDFCFVLFVCLLFCFSFCFSLIFFFQLLLFRWCCCCFRCCCCRFCVSKLDMPSGKNQSQSQNVNDVDGIMKVFQIKYNKWVMMRCLQNLIISFWCMVEKWRHPDFLRNSTYNLVLNKSTAKNYSSKFIGVMWEQCWCFNNNYISKLVRFKFINSTFRSIEDSSIVFPFTAYS